jgi:hypothetical protein
MFTFCSLAVLELLQWRIFIAGQATGKKEWGRKSGSSDRR